MVVTAGHGGAGEGGKPHRGAAVGRLGRGESCRKEVKFFSLKRKGNGGVEKLSPLMGGRVEELRPLTGGEK